MYAIRSYYGTPAVACPVPYSDVAGSGRRPSERAARTVERAAANMGVRPMLFLQVEPTTRCNFTCEFCS